MKQRNIPGVLIVGSGVVMRGSIVVPDTILTSGVINGEIKAHTIIVDELGAIRGKVYADTLDIAGSAKDNLTANATLIVRATGNVNGTIAYSEMSVERGGKVGDTLLALEGEAWKSTSTHEGEGKDTAIDLSDDDTSSY
jgi:cytoskeletal protein CcmA (bactofilin family)